MFVVAVVCSYSKPKDRFGYLFFSESSSGRYLFLLQIHFNVLKNYTGQINKVNCFKPIAAKNQC